MRFVWISINARYYFRYSLDDTSPPKEEAAHYEILSKATIENPADTSTSEECSLSEGIRNVQVVNNKI